MITYLPMISVIMPMKNAEPFVAAAVRSILSERGVPLELIVLDDGSTDRSAQVVQEIGDPRVRLLRGPFGGIAAAFNAGLEAARGRYVARCDADDFFTEGRLSRQLRWLERNPNFGAICGGMTTADARGRIAARLFEGHISSEITDELRAGKLRTALNTYLVRIEHFRQLAGCRGFFVTAEDVDLQLRLGETCRVWFEPVEDYVYRLHDASITHQRSVTLRKFYEECARSFQLQRQKTGADDLQRGTPPEVPAYVQGRSCAALHVRGMLLLQAWRHHAAGERLEAIGLGLRALAATPRSWLAWKSLLAMMIKPSGRAASAGVAFAPPAPSSHFAASSIARPVADDS